jgi:O-antigen/teichoic acid export membrane protein
MIRRLVTSRPARNAAAIALARVISSGAQFLWQIVLGRALGEALYGVYGAVGALFSIGVTIASFSLSLIVIREAARRPERAGAIWGAALFIQTLTGLIAYIGMVGASLGYDETIRAYAALAGLSLFLDTAGTHASDQLLARERMVSVSAVEIAHILVRLGLAAAALSLGWGLTGAYLATLVAGAGRMAALIALLWGGGVRPRFPIDWATAGALLRDAAPLTLYAFIGMTYTQIDRLIIAAALTDADAGHLTAAMVIVIGTVEVLNSTVLVALYPMLSRAAEGTGEAARFITSRLAAFTLLMGIPLWLGAALFAPLVIVPLFGERFAPAAEILRVLMGFTVVTMIANVYAQHMFAHNRQRVLVVFRVIGLAVKLTLMVLLLPLLGVVGAAVASLLSELGVLALLVRDFRRERTAARA